MSHPYPNLPSEFRVAGGAFGRMLVPFIAILAFFFVITLLLGAVLTESTGAGIGIGAGSTLVLAGVLYLKFRRGAGGAVLRFSPHGVELVEPTGVHVWLRWPDIVQIGEVHSQMADPRQVSAGGMAVGVGAMRSIGLIGWGHRQLPDNAPGWMRESLAAQPRNPVDGRPLVAIPAGQFDPQWLHGPIGQWVRLHRPDLLGR